jgi:EmrB/QacA subfamily drug resistance transporter
MDSRRSTPPPIDRPPTHTDLEAIPIPRWRQAIVDRLEARGGYSGWVLFAALAGMFSTTFPITILAVSLAPIAAEFGSTETTIAWVISGPMLLSAVTFPLLGKLGDLRGHRTIFLLGFTGATIVAALTALAWDAGSLIGFRTLAAILGGATQPTAMALIFSVYPPHERVRAMGWWSMTTAAAPALGLIAGGPLVDLFGWRIVFIFQAVLSAVALLLAYAVLRETPRKRVGFDLGGAASLAVGVGGIMFAIGSLRGLHSTSPWTLASLMTGLLALAVFVLIEQRVRDPLLPLEFFRSRNFSATLLTSAGANAGYMGAFIIAPMFLEGFGYSTTAIAFIILIRTATLTLASPLGGRLGERMGERWAAVFGVSLLTLGLSLVAWAAYHQSIPLFVLGLVGQGAGHGLSQPSITAAISHSVDESDLGIASAANRLMGQGGAAFGITILTLAYGGDNTPDAFALAFITGAALSALAAMSALWMGAHRIVLEHTSTASS